MKYDPNDFPSAEQLAARISALARAINTEAVAALGDEDVPMRPQSAGERTVVGLNTHEALIALAEVVRSGQTEQLLQTEIMAEALKEVRRRQIAALPRPGSSA